MQQVFVTGMLRSGTTLIQTLLTNHPRLFVAYQPFHQLYVDVKQMYLEENGVSRLLPLDNGSPAGGAERAGFLSWLESRRFDASEVERLAERATGGKGGGIAELGRLQASPGSFMEVRESLHGSMALRATGRLPDVIGSKEILCEEYVPALLGAGVRCVLIIRDPRGVIASANNGRYRDMVGDLYPLMMLIRLWRKSAAYWLKYRNHPMVMAVRYEDLSAGPDHILAEMARWLGVEGFPEGLARTPLKDHSGRAWSGNSSFGDRSFVDPSTNDSWRDLLSNRDLRFISACTKRELDAIGYPVPADIGPEDIRGFVEDTDDVRAAYLEAHAIDDSVRREELDRFALTMGQSDCSSAEMARYFLFPEALPPVRWRAAT